MRNRVEHPDVFEMWRLARRYSFLTTYLNTEIELNFTPSIGISFPRPVRATCAEYVMMQTNNLKVVINSKAENVQFAY